MRFSSIFTVAYTQKGKFLEKKIKDAFDNCGFCDSTDVNAYMVDTTSTDEIIKNAFDFAHSGSNVLLVFVCALGICVRKIAPFLQSKVSDPAVICVDDCGKFAVSVVGGHLGGANEATCVIAKALGAIPVVTTATDCCGAWAVDLWASESNSDFCLKFDFGERTRDVKCLEKLCKDQKSLSIKKNERISKFVLNVNSASLRGEKLFSVGIGCKSGVSGKDIFDFVKSIFEEKKLPFELIKFVFSIDLKKNERGIVDFSNMIGVVPKFFSADELNSVSGVDFSSSDFVRKTVGVDCVCERACVFGSDNGVLIIKKICGDGMTVAVAL